MSKEKTVLVVDDEPGFHALFRYLLEPLDVKVCSAHDGQEGWEKISGGDFALVFLDIHMPRMLGTEVLKKIRDSKPGQKVVVLSSSCDPRRELEKEALDMGVVECLDKPFDADKIVDIVKKTVGAAGGQGAGDV